MAANKVERLSPWYVAFRTIQNWVGFEWKRRKEYSGAEVIADDDVCDAARSLANLRLLSADVPPLPLEMCDRPATCKCKYRHFDDRRRSD
jgi:hypothetical protein